MLPAGIRRLFRLGRARDVEAEVDAELAFHFEQKVEALVARGMTPEGAREEARRQFGDLNRSRAELIRTDRDGASRRTRGAWRGDWSMDLRHALRGLAHTPGVTATVIVMLALGIGANAAMLGMLDRLLLRAPEHIVAPELVVRIAVTWHRAGSPDRTRTLGSYIDVTDFARGVPALTVAGYALPQPVKAGSGGDETLKRSWVTERFFEVLGARPAAGRVLVPGDASGPPVVVISDRFWKRQFGGARSALGASLLMDSVTYAIVGIMPPGFSGAEVNAADAWSFMDHAHGGFENWRTTRNTGWLEIIGRLHEAADRPAAIAQIESVRQAYRATTRWGADVTETAALYSIIPGRHSTFDGAGVRLALAVGVVSLLLLILAVANVSNLLLARGLMRSREYAVRAALGAGRARLVRLVVVESVVLALAGGLAAGLVGYWTGGVLRALILPTWQWASAPIGLLPALFAALAALAIGVTTGLIPGVLAARESALGVLRSGVQRGRGARGRVRSVLVAVQIAVSLVLVAATGVFVRSLDRALNEDHGVAVADLLVASVPLGGSAAAKLARIDEIVAVVRRVPGVADVTVTSMAPMRGISFSTVRIDGRDTSLTASDYTVATDFVARSRLRLLGGRDFTMRDLPGSEPVSLVDSLMAAQFWPGESPVGKCLYVEPAVQCTRVVGVVAHVRASGLREQPMPQFYLPLTQQPDQSAASLLIWSEGSAEALMEPVWRAIEGRVTNYPRTRVRNFATMLEPQVQPYRVGAILLAAAAALALALSFIGTFAVIAFAVRQRAHEFGVRRALGARTVHVLSLVLGEGLGVAILGVAAGVGGALWAARFAQPLLYSTPARDPAVLAVASLCLIAAAALASLGAARIALRADPRRALQAD